MTLLAVLAAGFIFRNDLIDLTDQLMNQANVHLPGLEQVVLNFSEISEIDIIALKERVSTPGPLRNSIDNPDAFLTVSGTLEETNRQRQLVGLTPYESNDYLALAAQKKLQDMFANEYFEHVSPDGLSPGELIEASGYSYVKVGENLALGNYDDDLELVRAWMESPPHKENILNENYTQVGIAVGQGMFEGQMTWLAVQEFGRPLSLCPYVDKSLAVLIDEGQATLNNMENKIEQLRSELKTEKPAEGARQGEIDKYNEKVDQYNALVRAYNSKGDEVKDLVEDYNQQVKAFNRCLQD